MPERKCPQCTQLMLVGRMGPLELDVCRPCGGVWFDCDELGQLIAAGPAVVRRLLERVPPLKPCAVPAVAPCPLCRVTLQSVEYASMPGIRLDACPFCEGFWMPHSTLERLAASLDGSRQWNQINAYAAPTAAPVPAAAVPAAVPAVVYPSQRPAHPSASPPPAAVPPPWAPIGAPPAPPIPAAAHSAPPPSAIPAGMMACPKCNELNGDSAVVCWACATALKGAKVGDCPRCTAPMREVFAETVAVNLCEACGSCATTPKRLNAILIQPIESRERLVKQVGRSRKGGRPVTSTPQCPACKVPMNETRLGMMSQLPLHACGQCYMLLISPATMEDIVVGQR